MESLPGRKRTVTQQRRRWKLCFDEVNYDAPQWIAGARLRLCARPPEAIAGAPDGGRLPPPPKGRLPRSRRRATAFVFVAPPSWRVPCGRASRPIGPRQRSGWEPDSRRTASGPQHRDRRLPAGAQTPPRQSCLPRASTQPGEQGPSVSRTVALAGMRILGWRRAAGVERRRQTFVFWVS